MKSGRLRCQGDLYPVKGRRVRRNEDFDKGFVVREVTILTSRASVPFPI